MFKQFFGLKRVIRGYIVLPEIWRVVSQNFEFFIPKTKRQEEILDFWVNFFAGVSTTTIQPSTIVDYRARKENTLR